MAASQYVWFGCCLKNGLDERERLRLIQLKSIAIRVGRQKHVNVPVESASQLDTDRVGREAGFRTGLNKDLCGRKYFDHLSHVGTALRSRRTSSISGRARRRQGKTE
jgi:hypothetical protein